MELRLYEGILLEMDRSVARRFNEENDPIGVVKKDGGKRIDPIAVGDRGTFAWIGRSVR